MKTREKEVWEAKSFMNGERVFVVMESRPARTRHGCDVTVHTVLHITGKKLGRVLIQTEEDTKPWDSDSSMRRLG